MSKTIAMKKIEFDEHGLITPAEIVELNLEELKQIFVKDQPESAHRQMIFAKYLEYNTAVKREIGNILFQFVNGSFTTLKSKPKDIDVVSFVDYRVYKKVFPKIKSFSTLWQQHIELDVFIVPKSYPGHPHFIEAQLQYEYWKDLFGHARKKSALGKNLTKGIIKINF